MAKILICDDEPEIRELLKSQLEVAGHVCSTVEQGLKAFKENLTNDFDLIITDIMMPQWTGYDLAGALELVKADVKVIVITGYAKNELLEKIKEVPNVAEIITKPWDRKKLLEIVDANI